jgi:LmbE family N-acetylglucosaminyl deacetylase
MKRILCISPHPDDEAIGCGGTLRAHAVAGDRVEVVFLTSGEKGGHGRSVKETVKVREDEGRAAAAILGVSRVEYWRMADGSLTGHGELADRITAKLVEVKPAMLYVPHREDMHADHRATAAAVAVALARAGVPREAWMFEVWTPAREINHIVDISAHLDKKLEAIAVYKTQCEHLDFVEAFRGLARYRGEMHAWPGGDYAEVFTRLLPARPAS